MSISTYAELQTAIASWLNRSDLTTIIPDFIRIAEEQLSLDLHAREMEAQTTLATVGDVATVALPSDMHEIRRFRVDVSYSAPLKYLTPDQISADYASDAVGQPTVYTVIGSNAQLAPVPDGIYSLELTYKQQLPSLSDSNTTNWLLTKWPSAYLYASLQAAEPFLLNDARIAVWQGLYQQQIERINGSDWFVGSTPTVRAL
jgi:hypothetical protein